MGLQVRKAHLDFLALVARFDEAGRPHQRPCLVAGIFMDVTGDFPEGHVRSALRLDWARAAVTSAREVKDGSAVMDPTCGGKQFACGANVDIAFLVEGEVAPGTVRNLVCEAMMIRRSIIWRSRKTCWTSFWPAAIRRTYSIKMDWSTS